MSAEVIPFPIIPRPIPGTVGGHKVLHTTSRTLAANPPLSNRPKPGDSLVIGKPFDPTTLFRATSFEVWTGVGRFTASATLCGHIDVVIPIDGEDNTITLSDEDALAVCNVLAEAVLDARKADPRDPRIVG